MNKRIASVLFVAGVGLAVACSVDVDVSKKACPCGPGYVCDETAQLCVVTLPVRPVPTGDAAVTPPAPACDPCPCATSAECTDKTRPFCDVASKTCVECDPKDDKCPEGRYCNETFQCTAGCRTNEECAKLSPGSPTCAVDKHQCVQCINDSTCGADKCGPNGTCVKRCTPGTNSCANGATCCGELCIDTKTDRFNCGTCDNRCTAPAGSTPTCVASKCDATCADGFKTCAAGTCATNIRTDLNNCGDCAKKCNMANVTGPRCAVGRCAYTACNAFWLDADGNTDNGCEKPCGQEQGMECCPGPTPCYEGKECKTNGPPAERNKCL